MLQLPPGAPLPYKMSRFLINKFLGQSQNNHIPDGANFATIITDQIDEIKYLNNEKKSKQSTHP
jgi:hypothetical protein